jgi:hypothetical protein
VKPAGPCATCDNHKLWHIEALFERGDFGGRRRLEIDSPGGRSAFEAWVCSSCGHMRWYSSSPPTSEGLEQSDCLDCARPTQKLTRVLQEGGIGPSTPLPVFMGQEQVGHFEMALCCECGLVRWKALGVSRLAQVLGDHGVYLTVDHPCGCGAGERVLVRPMREHGATVVEMRLVVRRLGGQGRLETHICTRCGAVDWFAYDLEELEPGRGVVLVEAKTAPRSPYR